MLAPIWSWLWPELPISILKKLMHLSQPSKVTLFSDYKPRVWHWHIPYLRHQKEISSLRPSPFASFLRCVVPLLHTFVVRMLMNRRRLTCGCPSCVIRLWLWPRLYLAPSMAQSNSLLRSTPSWQMNLKTILRSWITSWSQSSGSAAVISLHLQTTWWSCLSLSSNNASWTPTWETLWATWTITSRKWLRCRRLEAVWVTWNRVRNNLQQLAF